MQKYEVSYQSENFLSLSMGKKIGLIEKLIEDVSKLHQNQIYHRDIKGANIMFCPQNGLILCYYGIVFDVEKNSITTSETPGIKKLAPKYKTNEFSKQIYKHIPDVYLLGVFIWEVLNQNVEWNNNSCQNLTYCSLDKNYNRMFFNSKGRKKQPYNITSLNELLERTINTNEDVIPRASDLLNSFTNINAVNENQSIYLDETYVREILTILKTPNAIEVNNERVSHDLSAFSGETKLLITETSNKKPWEGEEISGNKSYEAELFKLTRLSNNYLKIEFQMTDKTHYSSRKPSTVFVQINEEVDNVIKSIENDIR